jgi:hypothetical protein
MNATVSCAESRRWPLPHAGFAGWGWRPEALGNHLHIRRIISARRFGGLLMRRLRHLLVAILTVLPVSLGVAATASAAPSDLTCAYSSTATFTPGVTPTPQDIAFGGTIKAGSQLSAATPCASGTGVPYIGAIGTMSGKATNLACFTTGLSGSASGTVAVTWFNPDGTQDHSTIAWSATLSGAVSVVADLSVAGGQVNGDTVVLTIALTGLHGNCALDPLGAVSVTGTITFL